MIRSENIGYLGKFIWLMMNTYIDSIHLSFKAAFSRISKIMNQYKYQTKKYQMAVWINIEETFLQSYSLAPYNLYMWPKKMRHLYEKLSKNKIGAIMPYMFILYKFLIFNKIKVIFISDRPKSETNIIRRNLSYFGVYRYYLLTNINTKQKKHNFYHEISREYNVISVLDDQPDLRNMPGFIQFPQIYYK